MKCVCSRSQMLGSITMHEKKPKTGNMFLLVFFITPSLLFTYSLPAALTIKVQVKERRELHLVCICYYVKKWMLALRYVAE
jgi:hypothetical protein